jgi:hypothetical protein
VHHYRRLLDRLEVDDMKWFTYDDHRAMHPFQIFSTYSGWLMRGKEMVYRHLPERVKRQFGFVQDVPRHLSDVPEIPKEILATMLIDPCLWFYTSWGKRCERAWQHEPGYMAWYAKVSHPQIIPPDEGSSPRPTNQKQLIEEEHATEMPDTLTIIMDVVQIADNAVAMSTEMILQEMIQIGSTGRPALISDCQAAQGA